jgi:galactokinase
VNRDRAVDAFVQTYGVAPTHLLRAPGRVNLIGEHTDYNNGFVLPCAIDRDTVVAARLTGDGMLTSVAADFGMAIDRMPLGSGFAPATAEWANYVRGMAVALAEDGVMIPGAQLAIAGNVPLGSGLSSSASLEIAVGAALLALSATSLPPARLAQRAQYAENAFVGCQCGIMDQLIATCGMADHALLIDCRSLDCTPVALPPGVAVIIAHSGVRHAHAGGEYNDRRAECDRATAHYGVTALRDLGVAALEAGKAGLDDTAFRRARHVVTENARTVTAATALAAGDLVTMGRLMGASHASMRDDFEITVPAVDRLADVAAAAIGSVGGARMTGGGFGGCIVALCPQAQAPAVTAAIARAYRTPDGVPAEVFVCRATAGAGPL